MVDQPFQQIGRLRTAGAAVGVHRLGVGEDALHPHIDRGRGVGADEHRRPRVGRDEGAVIRQVGAEIGDRVHPQPEEAPVAVQRQPGAADMVAPMIVAEEALRPLRRPLHGPVQAARGEQADHVFRVVEQLHAEAAADVRGDDAELFLRQPEELGELLAQAVHTLAGDVNDQPPAVRLHRGEAGAALHRIGDDAVVDDLQFHDAGGPGERRLDRRLVALLPVEAEVARRLVPHPRAVRLQRLRRAGDRGAVVVIDHHQFRRVAGGLRRLRHHHGDRIADMAHAALRQRRAGRGDVGGAVALRQRRRAGDRLDAVRLQVRDGEDAQDARLRRRLRDVDAADVGMGVGGAHEHRVALAGKRHVVGVAPAARQQACVFGAGDRLADAELYHGAGSFLWLKGTRRR